MPIVDTPKSRFHVWVKLALMMLLLGTAPAIAQILSSIAEVSAPTDDQPITPIPYAPAADPRKVALGERLFFDPALSKGGRRACSSCHDIDSNGADQNQLDTDPSGRPLRFNTSTVFNSALNFRMNWKGNARTAEEAVETSLTDPQLMASSAAMAVASIKVNHTLRTQLEMIYIHDPNLASLLDAIATYERSLLTPDSRFDL